MIKVLHYIPAFGYGGIENMVLNLYNNIDLKKISFDFLVECEVPKNTRIIIEKNGGNIIQIPKMTKCKNINIYLHELNCIFEQGNYDVFHCHSLQTRPFPMIYAKKHNVKIRILHIHANNFNSNKFYLLKKAMMLLGQNNANFFISCSKRAASSMLTKKNYKSAIILNNGIDIKKYKYSILKRKIIRKKLNIPNTNKLIVCIGRFSYLKNQRFIIDIDCMLSDKKFTFLFLGDGEDKKEIELIVKNKKMNNVIFAGNVDCVEDYMSASDLLVMPSISEALPLTIIEAQANGICCIVSKAIDKQFIINNNIYQLDLELVKWLELISKIDYNRDNSIKNSLLYNFEIKNTSKQYEKIIENLYYNNNY